MMSITLDAKLLAISAALVMSACGGASRDRTASNNGTARDAGAGQGTDAGDLSGYTEFGRGEYAIYLSEANPRRYCWYIEETVRICGGNGRPTRDDLYLDVCYDDETNCLARQPADSEVETGGCWTRITYDNVSNGALYGDCGRVDAYFADDPDTQCLYHRHCPEGRLCADYQCVCPPGAECACFDCPPIQGPRCEGEVLVVQSIGQGCDENDRCWIDEQRTDCAATGGTCNAARATCEGGSGGADAGVQDGGGQSTPDAGCLCPPTAPPRCEGDTSVTTTCDPADCRVSEVRLDCTASGEVCDPTTGGCVEDVECRVASDCPPPGPTPVGQCAEVDCVDNMCVETVNPC